LCGSAPVRLATTGFLVQHAANDGGKSLDALGQHFFFFPRKADPYVVAKTRARVFGVAGNLGFVS